MKEIHRLEEMARLGNFDDYEIMVYEGVGVLQWNGDYGEKLF